MHAMLLAEFDPVSASTASDLIKKHTHIYTISKLQCAAEVHSLIIISDLFKWSSRCFKHHFSDVCLKLHIWSHTSFQMQPPNFKKTQPFPKNVYLIHLITQIFPMNVQERTYKGLISLLIACFVLSFLEVWQDFQLWIFSSCVTKQMSLLREYLQTDQICWSGLRRWS